MAGAQKYPQHDGDIQEGFPQDVSSELGLNVEQDFSRREGTVGGEHSTSSHVEVGCSLAWLRNGQGLVSAGRSGDEARKAGRLGHDLRLMERLLHGRRSSKPTNPVKGRMPLSHSPGEEIETRGRSRRPRVIRPVAGPRDFTGCTPPAKEMLRLGSVLSPPIRVHK